MPGVLFMLFVLLASISTAQSCKYACGPETEPPQPPSDTVSGVDAIQDTGPTPPAVIVPSVEPSFVSADAYPLVTRSLLESMDLKQVNRLATECRELLRQGCLAVFERGAELTKGIAALKAKHVQFLFDLANELVRTTLWEDGQLAEDRFAAEDSGVKPELQSRFAGIERADRIYDKIIREYPGSPWEAQAALERALMYSRTLSSRWGRLNENKARVLLARVVRDYAKTPQSALALEELKRMGARKRPAGK